MELKAIPGVGEKTAKALARVDDVERALEEGDVAALSAAPGISPARAARIARATIRQAHDEEATFLATDRARAIHADLLALLKERAVTDYATHRLETLYPSTAPSRIQDVQELSERAMALEPTPELTTALADLEPLRPPNDVRIRDRCLATGDAERYSAATEAVPEMSVELVDDARDVAELARGYGTVIVLDEEFAGIDVDGDVHIDPDALEHASTLVPERTLAFFARNAPAIRAAMDVHALVEESISGDVDALEAALDRLGSDGEPTDDAELDRLRAALDDLNAAIETAEHVAEDRLRGAIRDRDVTIQGTDLLSLVEQGAGVDSLLEQELAAEHEAALQAAREHLVDALGLEDHEVDLARECFPEQLAYPVEADDEAVSRLREQLREDRDARGMRLKRDLAATLADHRDAAEQLVRRALELDVELAVARFAADYECTMPTFEGEGLAIDGGRSPLLAEPLDEIDPIDYDVGDVVLLSGVNSGGKTALLDLLAATVVLAQMGLPVPAREAKLQRFEALHYHAATQGTLDAGAFEATLRQFADLAAGPAERLVLVDELESITEPGAAANIVAGVLEALRGSATAVFVSHLASEVREAAAFDVRVDGIEAEGVVDGELVVNRTPVCDYLARSTPELLVERLAGEADGDTGPFYDRLLEKFD